MVENGEIRQNMYMKLYNVLIWMGWFAIDGAHMAIMT